MQYYQGFKTKTEALAFKRDHGGRFCHAQASTTVAREAYNDAVVFGGLDANKYPYCVSWKEDEQ